jgi:hypothetical protein
MSAAVCGKRSVFDDLHSSPPVAKRLRFAQASSSAIRFPPSAIAAAAAASPPSSSTTSGTPFEACLEAAGSSRHHHHHSSDGGSVVLLLRQLHALFPEMEAKLVEKVLESCGNSLDSAIKSLTDLRLSSSERSVSSSQDGVSGASVARSSSLAAGMESLSPSTTNSCRQKMEAAAAGSLQQLEGEEWVELLVREMMNAADLDDARARATHTLEAFEKTVASRSAAVMEVQQKENIVLKEQLQGLIRDNHILKRAVAIQHERQIEHEGRTRELQQVKQLLAQYQEQVRTLELSNYSLTLHLRKAQEGSSMPGRFHPDVF